LTDEPDHFDIVFQLAAGRVILEAVPSADGKFGQAFGTVGGLIAGLAESEGQALLDGGARRMRALTGYDRVTLFFGGERAESSRGGFAEAAIDYLGAFPPLLCDVDKPGVSLFPRRTEDEAAQSALLRSPEPEQLEYVREQGIRSSMRVPFTSAGERGEFRCDGRMPRLPQLEVHAAAELFAQLFSYRLEIDRLKRG